MSPPTLGPPADTAEGAVVIPFDVLNEDTLRGVIEAFVLREGTDYGAREFSLPEKVEHVMSQLRRKEAQILFNPVDQSIDIITKDKARR
jgi:uncharacterized protein YheU (UPF0270 family)